MTKDQRILAKLCELLNEHIEDEKENYDEARNSAGIDCAGACMADGAITAYRQVMQDIIELEHAPEAVLDKK